jgi:hypothetical protein
MREAQEKIVRLALRGETLARTLTVRPESCSILYAGDTGRRTEEIFSVGVIALSNSVAPRVRHQLWIFIREFLSARADRERQGHKELQITVLCWRIKGEF